MAGAFSRGQAATPKTPKTRRSCATLGLHRQPFGALRWNQDFGLIRLRVGPGVGFGRAVERLLDQRPYRRVLLAGIESVACCDGLLVRRVGIVVHKPLSRVPENTLKFGVGTMLSAFGVFWTGEGLGVAWPLGDLAIVALAALFLGVALLAVVALKRPRASAP